MHPRVKTLDALSNRPNARSRHRYCVLDLETRLDPHAQILSGRRSPAPKGSPINEITVSSTLTFDEDEDGTFGDFELTSWYQPDYSERDIVVQTEDSLLALGEAGTLVTFNGRGFDLPLLRMRLLRWWICRSPVVTDLLSPARHIDVMLELSIGEGRWPSLADACASVGFALYGPTSSSVRDTSLPPQLQRCERDVVGTAILLMYVLAGRRADPTPLRKGLGDLGRYLRLAVRGRPHLSHLAANQQLSFAENAWGHPVSR